MDKIKWISYYLKPMIESGEKVSLSDVPEKSGPGGPGSGEKGFIATSKAVGLSFGGGLW